jgi:hypothetical protein
MIPKSNSKEMRRKLAKKTAQLLPIRIAINCSKTEVFVP